jgi:hypothetical protein
MICPYCHKDANAKEPYDEIVKFLRLHGNTVNLCNPGGREFHFPKFGRVQISDYCHYCDLQKLKDVANEHLDS